MEAAEDMFLVIIGDESSEENSLKPINLDKTEGVTDVVDILKTAEKHGEYFDIQIKQEPEYNIEYLDEESLLQCNIKVEDSYETQGYADNNQGVEYECNYKKIKKNKRKTNGHRYTMLKPSERRSFVAELRVQFPELDDDKELLVDTLAEIMKNVKPPQLPKDFYYMDFNRAVCKECGAGTESIAAVGRHYQEKHGERYLVCYTCGVDFRSKTNLYKHEKRCIAPDAATVLKARVKFLGQRARSRPYLSQKTRHSKPKNQTYPCLECSAVFQNKTALQSHEYLHRGVRPFQCHVCPSAYTSQSALSRHTKTHTDVQFICDHCSRSFKVKAALVTHMDTHRPLRKHACVECGRRFAQRGGLRAHRRRDHHRLPPPCACQLCPKRYPRMSLLKIHMKKEHDMILMTRKMYFKSLPTMTSTEMMQAKVIFKTDKPYQLDFIKDKDPISETTEQNKPHIEESINDEYNKELDTSEKMQTAELMQYINLMQSSEIERDSQNVFIYQNGEIINIQGTVIDENKNNLIREIENMIGIEVKLECVEPETEDGVFEEMSMPSL